MTFDSMSVEVTLWLYPRIIVSKSHDNTSMYVDTVINFAKYHIHTHTYILHSTYRMSDHIVSQFIESHVSHMKMPAIWECASSVLSFYTLVHVINGTCIERWLTMELLEIVTECLKWRHVVKVKKEHRWNQDGVEIITEEFGDLSTEELGKKRMVIANFWFCFKKKVDSSGVSWHYCM